MLKQQEIQSIKTSNSMQSALLIGVLLVILGYTGYALVGLNLTILLIGTIVGMYMFAPRFSSGRMLMRMFKGRPLEFHQAPKLHQIVDELARRAELDQTPKLYYVPQKQINAFAFNDGKRGGIAISQGLLKHLSLNDVAGVLAHEMSHIRHNDLSVMTLATMISNMTRTMANVGWFLLIINLPLAMFGMFPLSWTAIFLLIFAPTVAAMVQLALSRVREFRADLGAAQLLGTPQPLVSALHKMDQLNRGLFGMFAPSMRLSGPAIFSTHPPTRERIRRLQAVSEQPLQLPRIRIETPPVIQPRPQTVWM